MATPSAYAKDAIEIMFAWHQGSDDLALERLQRYVDGGDFGGDPAESLRNLMSGMINVCGKLLVMREQETGTSVDHTLTVLGVNSRRGSLGNTGV